MRTFKKTIQIRTTALLGTALLAVLSSTNLPAGNLLIDPGFEMQTAAVQGGWTIFYGEWFLSGLAHSGNWSMAASGGYSVSGCFEQFPAAPGSKWRLTGYGIAPFSLQGSDPSGDAPAFGLIQFSFFDIHGQDLGTVETQGAPYPAKVSNTVDPSTPANEWVSLDTGVATAPEGTAYIRAFTIYVDYSGLSWSQGVCFDDLDLEIVNANHGQYVSSIAHNADQLKQAGLITGAQAAALVEAAAESAGGKK
jgi:hypothetical protein